MSAVSKPGGELTVTPKAAQMQAEVSVGVQLAQYRPRSEGEFTDRMEAACRDSDFADAAIFRLQRGSKKDEFTGRWVPSYVNGFGVRMSEEAIRVWGNTRADVEIEYDDEHRRAGRVHIWDLQTNHHEGEGFAFNKTVERKKPYDREVVSVRTNSKNQQVSVCRATDQEVEEKQSSLCARKLRNLRLKLIPEHIKRRLWKVCQQTMVEQVAGDRETANVKIIGWFDSRGVNQVQVEARLGCTIVEATAEQLIDLRLIANAIKDGDELENYFKPDARPQAERTQATRQTRESATAHGGKASGLGAANGREGDTAQHEFTPDPDLKVRPPEGDDSSETLLTGTDAILQFITDMHNPDTTINLDKTEPEFLVEVIRALAVHFSTNNSDGYILPSLIIERYAGSLGFTGQVNRDWPAGDLMSIVIALDNQIRAVGLPDETRTLPDVDTSGPPPEGYKPTQMTGLDGNPIERNQGASIESTMAKDADDAHPVDSLINSIRLLAERICDQQEDPDDTTMTASGLIDRTLLELRFAGKLALLTPVQLKVVLETMNSKKVPPCSR